MRRNLILLNLLLIALCALVGWRYTQLRQERLAEQARFLARSEKPLAPPVVLLSVPPAPAPAAAYVDVAQQLLLSPDRNPTVVIDIVPPKPMPPLPRAYGAMDLGSGPRVMLAAAPGAAQRSYAPGDTIGEFKLLTITTAGVIFEWNGKRVAARYDEMKDTSAPAVQAASAATTAASAGHPAAGHPAAGAEQKGALVSVAGDPAVQGKPGEGQGYAKHCLPGDKSAEGTVAEGYKKVIMDLGAMGKSCYWEKIQ